jgi:hypothetical protein
MDDKRQLDNKIYNICNNYTNNINIITFYKLYVFI